MIGVPLVATALTVMLLRRVAITPLGLVRASQRRRVRAWPGLLELAGLLGFAALEAASRTAFVRDRLVDAMRSDGHSVSNAPRVTGGQVLKTDRSQHHGDTSRHNLIANIQSTTHRPWLPDHPKRADHGADCPDHHEPLAIH